MTDATRSNMPSSQHRRLGRGLSGLLSLPVDVAPTSETATADSGRLGARAGALGSAVAPAVFEAAALEAGTGGSRPVGGLSPDAAADGAPTPQSSGDLSEPPPAEGDMIIQLPVGSLRPNTRQPRRDFPDAALASLAASLAQVGVLQPVIVRPIPATERGLPVSGEVASTRFELVAGERRWRAAQLAGLTTIPAIVRPMDDRESGLAALIENVQREDLNPIDRADGLQRLIDEFGLTHQELASQVSLDRSSVTNLLRLRDLEPFTRDAVRTGRLSQGHAKALLALSDANTRRQVAAAAMAGDWSVRELERRVRLLSAERETSPVAAIPAPSTPSAHVADLERRLSEHLGSRVRIQLGRKKGTGRVVLEFFNLDQFDGLLAKLGFDNPE